MEKKCLIIMPTSDPEGYAQGHFDRVYQYIIVPACRLAGFSPVRAGDPIARDSGMDILKDILVSSIAICDLSANNLQAPMGFAIRQALNLPVTLIKDLKTRLTVDVVEFGTIDYDDSLRIDTVQKEIEILSEALTKSFENKSGPHSLLNRLNIGAAPVQEIQNTYSEPVVHEEKKEESHLPVISPLPDYAGDTITQQEDIDKLKVGDFLFHRNYGKGEITAITKMAKDKMAKIQFESGSKLLVLGTSGIYRKIIG